MNPSPDRDLHRAGPRADPADEPGSLLSGAYLPLPDWTPEPSLTARFARLIGRLFLHLACLAIALAAFFTYEHFRLAGDGPQAWAALAAAALFGAVPLRDLLGFVFSLRGGILHFAHGLSGLGLAGLAAGGVISGAQYFHHAALAPLALVGAVQAPLPRDGARSREQGDILQRFTASLAQLGPPAGAANPESPASLARRLAALNDIVAKAETLGQAELRDAPGLPGMLRRASARAGLALGLDAVEHALAGLPANPAAQRALRERIAKARARIDGGTRPRSALRVPAAQEAARPA